MSNRHYTPIKGCIIVDMRSLSLIKVAVREATAFLGHSLSDEDRQIVERVTQFLTKLGVKCDSGVRAEPRPVSEKVRERLIAAEIFVGLFTRRDKKSDGTYTTSPWIIEEKAAAIQAGKKLLLFVEDGVEKEIGGLQGDYEYIPFSRSDPADALIRAMDYVLAITTVPLQCQVDYATNSINLKLGASNVTIDSQIKQLLHQKQLYPNNPQVIYSLAESLEKNNQRETAITELQSLIRSMPQLADAHHRLAHLFENGGQLEESVLSYQNALDRNPHDYKSHRCYGKCLYQKARTIAEPVARRSTLEKAGRLLNRAAVIGGEQRNKEISSDIFLVQEALSEFESARPGSRNQRPQPFTSKNQKAKRKRGKR